MCTLQGPMTVTFGETQDPRLSPRECYKVKKVIVSDGEIANHRAQAFFSAFFLPNQVPAKLDDD